MHVLPMSHGDTSAEVLAVSIERDDTGLARTGIDPTTAMVQGVAGITRSH